MHDVTRPITEQLSVTGYLKKILMVDTAGRIPQSIAKYSEKAKDTIVARRDEDTSTNSLVIHRQQSNSEAKEDRTFMVR